MTTQNRQKSNAKKKTKKTDTTVAFDGFKIMFNVEHLYRT